LPFSSRFTVSQAWDGNTLYLYQAYLAPTEWLFPLEPERQVLRVGESLRLSADRIALEDAKVIDEKLHADRFGCGLREGGNAG
jgi:hypothetical protein